MHYAEVILPGGMIENGYLERRARFRPLTGRIEQALIEFGVGLDRPGYVTAVLNSTIDCIGDRSATSECIAALCVADRQYLMLRLMAMLSGEQMWLKIDCSHCGAPFDVNVRRCDLPVKEAGQGYPQVSLCVNERTIKVRVPGGADQERIGGLSEEEAIKQLLQSCICSVDNEPSQKDFIDNLSLHDIAAIDGALDEASPAVCNQLLVTCPECGQEQNAALDHYDLAGMNEHSFYDEVHALASHYHWSEEEILNLPRTRRHLYLGMITRSAGMNE